MMTTTENNEPVSSEPQPKRRTWKKSIVWKHFTVESVGNGCTRAFCKQCNKSFAYSTGSKVAGTSHLKRHIILGNCPVARLNMEKNQLTPDNPTLKMSGSASDPPKKRFRGSITPLGISFDEDRGHQEIAKMIIMHEYPLHMVEHSSFISFVQYLQPKFNMLSFNAVQGDCVAIYLREKQSLLKLLGAIPGWVNLSLDMWTSNRTLGYVFLTGHFIGKDWKLHQRILNVVMVPSPNNANAFSHAVGICLSDWNLEGKLFTVTLDQRFSYDIVSGSLRGHLSIKSPLILNGQLVIGHCYARVLSSIAQDALEAMRETVNKVRESVKYVKISDAHEEKFIELKNQLQNPSMKSLSLDDQTQWNTTYHMLVAALELKEVFSCLDTTDPDYKEAPSMDEWKQVEILCTYLKLLYDAANILTGETYPTTNIFFHEVWKIYLELTRSAMSEDSSISKLTKPLQVKFEKYWKDCSIILAISVSMDPRFKLKLIEFSFSKIYGEEAGSYFKIVDEGIHELYQEYLSQPLPLPPTYVEHGIDENVNTDFSTAGILLTNGDGLLDFDIYISEISSSQNSKSELDQYLEESLMPRLQELDILNWWKLNSLKYPILSKMACDLLSIPLTTVAHDSIFYTGRKEVDRYRSSLRPETLEALICAKDWLQYESTELPGAGMMNAGAIVKMEF